MIVTFCYHIVKRILKKINFSFERLLFMEGLKAIRKKKGFSQLKVAMDLNISREALSYYENGKRSPDIQMLRIMSEYFDVSIDFLINGHEFTSKYSTD